jgi:hypothetical protein
MGDHTIYKRPEGETTEWDDIQVKYGNKEPPKPVSKPEPFAPKSDKDTKDTDWLQKQSEAELEDLEDDFMDDPILETIRLGPYNCLPRNVERKHLLIGRKCSIVPYAAATITVSEPHSCYTVSEKSGWTS